MKALTVKQPWASLIIYGGKDIENRSWATEYRGRVFITASKGWNSGEQEAAKGLIEDRKIPQKLSETYTRINCGGVIGTVEIVDCVKQSDSPWFVGPFGWVLRNPRPLVFRPMSGALGLWDMEYPESAVGTSRVLFLDVDGVLNGGVGRGLDEVMLARLGSIIRHADPAVVISSSWRIEAELLRRITLAVERLGGRVVGHTPLPEEVGQGSCRIIAGRERWVEIQDWLDAHPVADGETRRVVILDDEAEMGPLGEYHVRTEYESGLQRQHVERALRLLLDPPRKTGPTVLELGKWYVLRSARGIRWKVRLVTISPCGKYCRVSYSGSAAGGRQCLASELEDWEEKAEAGGRLWKEEA